MKKLLKYAGITALILVPVVVLAVVVLGVMDPDAQLADWIADVRGAEADRLPPEWDAAAICKGAADTAQFKSGENECHVLAWKIETDGGKVVSERCLVWIHNRSEPADRWAGVNLQLVGNNWKGWVGRRPPGNPNPTETRAIWMDPPNLDQMKQFIDGASWSFAPQVGKEIKDSGIARQAGQRLFGVHMDFLLRRYKELPPPPPPATPGKGSMSPQPGKKR
jgi:hypothetical protein